MSAKDCASNVPSTSKETKQSNAVATSWSDILRGKTFKSLLILGLFLYVLLVFLSASTSRSRSQKPSMELSMFPSSPNDEVPSATEIRHIVFGIAGLSKTWAKRKSYIESWWLPNITRGYLFLDRTPFENLPWPPTSPPYRISKDNSRYKPYYKNKMPYIIRLVRVIEEMFNAFSITDDGEADVRWFVLTDDDTVLIIDNLLEVLKGYDHKKYWYIGMNSECVLSNFMSSFEMAFGGAGYALSYPLAKAVAKNMDLCIKRYPTLYTSDHIMQSCIADLGVSLTYQPGFHQIDMLRDISGLLSAHPQSPFLSLHHLDKSQPIFPSKNRHEAVDHLMKAARVDASRLLQQSICYDRRRKWTFSVSWGYSVQIYEVIIPPSTLRRPVETFTEWGRGARPPYMFNTRRNPAGDPCKAPHVFFFDLASPPGNFLGISIASDYTRKYPRRLPPCGSNGGGNHSADMVSKIKVHSPLIKLQVGNGKRRECCDILEAVQNDTVEVKLRACREDEIIP